MQVMKELANTPTPRGAKYLGCQVQRAYSFPWLLPLNDIRSLALKSDVESWIYVQHTSFTEFFELQNGGLW